MSSNRRLTLIPSNHETLSTVPLIQSTRRLFTIILSPHSFWRLRLEFIRQWLLQDLDCWKSFRKGIRFNYVPAREKPVVALGTPSTPTVAIGSDLSRAVGSSSPCSASMRYESLLKVGEDSVKRWGIVRIATTETIQELGRTMGVQGRMPSLWTSFHLARSRRIGTLK
jgi:hypothetical protein